MWRKRAAQIGDVMQVKPGESYRVHRFIAEGGYSEVYEVVRLETGDHLAMKVLQLDKEKSPKTLERHRREGETLYRLRHPNVVAVHAVGVREDGLIFLIMDLLVGRTLHDLKLDLGGRIPISWVLEIMCGVCEGLDAVHAIDLVHRDLKPHNIHVGDDGMARLFDFGASKFPKERRLTTGGMTLGTIDYMSPEQLLEPQTIDGRSDQFAFGVILYELLSGAHPWAVGGVFTRDPKVLGRQIIWQRHQPLKEVAPHVPDYVVEIVERCLKKDRDERYRSAGAVWDLLSVALERFIAELAEHAPPPLATVIVRIPRTQRDGDSAEVPGVLPAANPFLTVSLPQEQHGGEVGGPHGTAPLRVGPEAAPDTATPTLRSGTNPEHAALALASTEEIPAFEPVGAPASAPGITAPMAVAVPVAAPVAASAPVAVAAAAPVAAAVAVAVPVAAAVAVAVPVATPVAAATAARSSDRGAKPPSSITPVEITTAPARPAPARPIEAEEEHARAPLPPPPRKSGPAKRRPFGARLHQARAFGVVVATALCVVLGGLGALRALNLWPRLAAPTPRPLLSAPVSPPIPTSAPPSATVTAAPPPSPPPPPLTSSPPPQPQASASARTAPTAPPRPAPPRKRRLPPESF